jgi:hypothetical protein
MTILHDTTLALSLTSTRFWPVPQYMATSTRKSATQLRYERSRFTLLPISVHTSVLTEFMRHPGVERRLGCLGRYKLTLEEEEDPYELPLAYSSLDVSHLSQCVRADNGNGDVGGE